MILFSVFEAQIVVIHDKSNSRSRRLHTSLVFMVHGSALVVIVVSLAKTLGLVGDNIMRSDDKNDGNETPQSANNGYMDAQGVAFILCISCAVSVWHLWNESRSCDSANDEEKTESSFDAEGLVLPSQFSTKTETDCPTTNGDLGFG